jgi:hypothetical protein
MDFRLDLSMMVEYLGDDGQVTETVSAATQRGIYLSWCRGHGVRPAGQIFAGAQTINGGGQVTSPAATMRAMCAVGPDPASLTWQSLPVPESAPGELLVEVRATPVTAGELTWPETWRYPVSRCVRRGGRGRPRGLPAGSPVRRCMAWSGSTGLALPLSTSPFPPRTPGKVVVLVDRTARRGEEPLGRAS